MLRLELAIKLHDAGLKWVPNLGDWYEVIWEGEGGGSEIWNTCDRDPDFNNLDESNIWYPRLDNLLKEIESRGYLWRLEKPIKENKYIYELMFKGMNKLFFGDNPIEVTAQALLWILEER